MKKMWKQKNVEIEQFAPFALPCSLHSHHKANPTPKMAAPLLALPTHHPKQEKVATTLQQNNFIVSNFKEKLHFCKSL